MATAWILIGQGRVKLSTKVSFLIGVKTEKQLQGLNHYRRESIALYIHL